jgi:hypothetical protein
VSPNHARPLTARKYVLGHDDDVRAWDRLPKRRLEAMLGARRAAAGIVSLTGTAGWSHQEVLNALLDLKYDPAGLAAARAALHAAYLRGEQTEGTAAEVAAGLNDDAVPLGAYLQNLNAGA